MADSLSAPPVLSTPDTRILEDPTLSIQKTDSVQLSDAEIYEIYEIERTARELKKWTRIALQFPDDMLGHAPRVFEALEKVLQRQREEYKTAEGLQNDVDTIETTTKSAKGLK